ncbi:aspartate aminotransferase family protein [Flavobacterium terrigena]|uniref:Acetylornithine aminotransferase n=1 Tax=Flavobacterium terrigena TaxID=402734 RepID=A0A1H6TFK6_9FLAO|nr:aminotransferase class III-fold pyridoxal phosphate-dependent enzyme [Flavobacterium terrigena]SEI78808.1 acetylornithine aminotransferase [Flavobacterium terrigena]
MENIVEEKTSLFDVYSIFPIEIQKALGSKLWDNKGTEYLDLYGGHAVISIGHSHPEYVTAITKQLKNIGFYSNSIEIKLQNQLAQKLGELSGYTDYNLFLCNSGAEANENAFKLASFYNGRKKIIAFKQGFHGRTSLAVAATDNPKIVAPINENQNIIFLPLNDIEAFDNAFDEEISCVIIEGIQGVGGINIPDAEFLQHLEKRCNEKNSILILDEVQSGYGRTGKFFAHQHANIKPHIITMAKGMGNGFPVGGLLISPTIEAQKEMLGTTFGGNYLACAAAISVLNVLEKEHLIENALVLGDYLKEAFLDIPQIKEVRGLGLMIGIELDQPCAEIRNTLLSDFKIFTGSSSNKNTLRILPSLAVTIEEIDQFIHALKDILK